MEWMSLGVYSRIMSNRLTTEVGLLNAWDQCHTTKG